MIKYIANNLDHLIQHDSSWKIYNKNKKPKQDFFLLFNYFKPIDKVLNTPSQLKNPQVNVIFVHKGIRLLLRLKTEKGGVVKRIFFDKRNRLIEPFAVYIKDPSIVKVGDSVETILHKAISNKHIVKEV